MKQTKKLGVSLLMIELLLGLLVFAFAAAICTRIFAGAYQMSADGAALSQAVSIARSAAESVRAGRTDLETAFDGQGAPAEGAAAFLLSLKEVSCADGLTEVELTVTDAAGKPLYSVTAVKGGEGV